MAIEGKFGQAKRRFSLARVMPKLAATAQCAIAITFLVMNLERWLRQPFFSFFGWVGYGLGLRSALRGVEHTVETAISITINEVSLLSSAATANVFAIAQLPIV